MFRYQFLATIFAIYFFGATTMLSHHKKTTGYIIGGEMTVIGRFRYMVQVGYYGKFLCAGSILTNVYVLTSANCVYSLNETTLFIRSRTSLKNIDGDLTPVAEIKVHPLYAPPGYSDIPDYDVAILRTKIPLAINTRASPITLSNNLAPVGQIARVIGWGSNETLRTAMVHYAGVEILPQDRCQQSYREFLTSRMFCAASPNRDTCKGDAGGPIVLNEVQIGVASLANGCGKAGFPGLYTDVSQVRPFIDEFTSRTVVWND